MSEQQKDSSELHHLRRSQGLWYGGTTPLNEKFDMRIMQKRDISAFVQAVVDIGCDIHAIGHWGYVFGDGDLTPAQQRAIAPQLRWIAETYGERDYLTVEIIEYLWSIGRYVEIEPQTRVH